MVAPKGKWGTFEALPQKPHPLQRGVKNTEFEIASPQATCLGQAGWAVTPPPTAGATGRGGAKRGWQAPSGARGRCRMPRCTEASPPPPLLRALRSNLDHTCLNICLIRGRSSKASVQPTFPQGIGATYAWAGWFSEEDPYFSTQLKCRVTILTDICLSETRSPGAQDPGAQEPKRPRKGPRTQTRTQEAENAPFARPAQW